MLHCLYIIFFILFVANGKIIEYPKCSSCVHFISHPSSNPLLCKCGVFGKKNTMTGEIKHDYVDECRADKQKCGLEAKYFLEGPPKPIIYHILKLLVHNI